MENSTDEYFKKFRPEKIELIVRINRCWEKGSCNFDMIENYYKVGSSFDKAVDVKTGKLLETGVGMNRLEWLAPKKILGFKYGYKFTSGNIYRLLVRENIPKKGDLYRLFYIEQVLEEDVKEPLLIQFVYLKVAMRRKLQSLLF